jgi:hypothetical protein
MDELKRRLERLLGNVPATPVDVSQQRQVEVEAELVNQHRQRVAAAGGELLGAALSLVGELVSPQEAADPAVVDQIRTGLAGCSEHLSDGRLQLQLTLQNDDHLNRLAATLAKLLVPSASKDTNGET